MGDNERKVYPRIDLGDWRIVKDDTMCHVYHKHGPEWVWCPYTRNDKYICVRCDIMIPDTMQGFIRLIEWER